MVKTSADRPVKEEKYFLTFKGLLEVCLNFDEDSVRKVMDGLELYLRRNCMSNNEYGAIIFTGKEWIITSVEKYD